MDEGIVNILHHFSDEKLQEIISRSTSIVRQEQELLHLALAEVARRRLGVNRQTADDIA